MDWRAQRLLLLLLLILLLLFVQVYHGLKSCTSLFENVSLRVPPSNLWDFSLFGVCPSNKHYLLLGASMLPTWRVKISIYLQLEPFLSITFTLINLKLLILFVHYPNILCYVILVTSHLRLFACLFVYFSALICFSCNLSLTLCCVCP
jgi:hypothetical protein